MPAWMRCRKNWGIGCAIVLTIGVVAAAGYRYHKRYRHLAVHDAGMVYRSGWVDADVFAELIDKYQIRTVINLCNPNEMGAQRCVDQRKAVIGSGAALLEWPMPATVDAADPDIARYVKVLSDPASYPILVHCQHGVTRTAKLLTMYDILFRGMTADESLAAMPLFGRDSYNVSVRAFARSFEKEHAKLYPQVARRLDVLRQ
jgi:hypothetical protein